ncbi:MAG: thiamine diphosphokinase [Acidimicrobiaceae bacterium]|nr:thiamine diphosphokinase [Acidimicrobiaceae bacterium]
MEAMNEELTTPVVILCGGPAPNSNVVKHIPTHDFLIAVDSGLDHARTLGLEPNLVIGDLDSVSHSGLSWAKKQKIEIKQFSTNKDKSDLELALDESRRIGNSVFVVGSDSGRFDHVLGIIAALSSAAPFFTQSHALIGNSYLTFINENDKIYLSNGRIVSIFALGEHADGVTLRGFKWELVDASLPSRSTLGLSNELLEQVGEATVESGVLVAIQTGAFTV